MVSAGKWLLPGQHILELLHVFLGGDVPAEVLLHVPLLEFPEGGTVGGVQAQAAAQGGVEVVGVVALEGEAQALDSYQKS